MRLVRARLRSPDAAGRAWRSREPVENQDPQNPTGNIVGTTDYYLSTVPGFFGTVVETTDAAQKKGRSITNALGQLVLVDEPDSMGNLAALPQSTPNPVPNPTPTGGGTGHGNCLIPVNCPENAIGGSYGSYSTFYTYDAYGKMVEVAQGDQKRWFKYDSLGRLLRVRQPEQEINTSLATTGNPDNNAWTAGFTYDVLGNVIRATDANGVNIVNEYDKASRVTKRCYTKPNISTTATTCAAIPTNDRSTDTPTVEFFYDGKGLDAVQTPHNFAKGKLTKVSNTVSQTLYRKFDNLGRLEETEQTTPIDETIANARSNGRTYVSKYKYNLSGALTEEEYPSGRVVKNAFESDGDLLTVTSKKTPTDIFRQYASNFSYTASGGISQMRLGNGRWETAKFNTRLQVEELGLGTSAVNAGSWKVNYTYGEFDDSWNFYANKNTGNIAKQTLTIPGVTFEQKYRYDSLYRLKDAVEPGSGSTPNWTQTFIYDRYGNRTSFTQTVGGTTTHDSTPAVSNGVNGTNRFTSSDFEYDKNGNLVGDLDPVTSQPRDFLINADNKQREVVVNSATVGQYFYDGEGKRVKKVVGNETIVFVYSSGKLIAEYTTTAPPATGHINYTTTDHLGSPRIITNELGQVTSRRDFMPFGEDLFNGVGARTEAMKYGNSGDDIKQKFTGYLKDDETKLDFAEARMYENRFGRFTAVDPLLASGKSANPQTFNRYVYTSNNPVIRVDRNGKEWIVERSRGYLRPAWIDPDEYDGQELWTNMLYFSRESRRWFALDPNSNASYRSASYDRAYWRHGLYTDFNGGFDGLFDGNVSFKGLINDGIAAKDLAYLVGNIKTGNIDGALGTFSKIAAANGAAAGLGNYFAKFLERALGSSVANNFIARLGSPAFVPKGASPLGVWGERRLAQLLGGAVEKNTARIATSMGPRVPDYIVDGIAHEAKAGLNVALTSSIRKQILKDAELITTSGEIKGVHWHFFQGAQQEVLDFLTQNGIKYTVH